MKLLYLIHRLPCPADGGAKLRAAAQLRYLAQRHDVWCAGFLETGVLGRPTQEARESLDGSAIDLPRGGGGAAARVGGPGSSLGGAVGGRDGNGKLLCFGDAAAAGDDAGRSEVGFDAVLAFSSSMAPLALRVPAPRRVLDLDDLDSRKWAESAAGAGWPMRWVYRTEAERLARREQQWLGELRRQRADQRAGGVAGDG